MGNTKELKWGYIRPNGEFAIAPAFYGAGDFCDGMAAVKVDCGCGFIDREGNFREGAVTTPVYEPECGYNPQYELHDGLARFVENQKFGYKDKDGNVVIKAQFFDAGDFSEGLACVKKGKTSMWGYIDTAGKFAIPAQFRQAHSFREGLAAVLTAIF